MGVWTDRVVPRMAERSLSTGELMRERAKVCTGLTGRLLEIGFGSGLNVGLYPDEVTSIAAVEPSDVGWSLSSQRRARSDVPVTRTGLDGQALIEEDDSCDSALCTFTLCTIPDAARALAEVRRVLRPGGTLAFLEHGLAPDAGVARWQRRLDPFERRIAGGCHLSRDVLGLVTGADFEITYLDQRYLSGPRIARPWIYGYAGHATSPTS